MKPQTARLAVLAVLLLAAVGSSATMSSGYSTYDSITPNTDGNGTLISVTVMVQLEGMTTGWYGMPPAKHTGHVGLTFGGVSNSNYTPPVNPDYNMNLWTTVTLDDTATCFTQDDPGCVISVDSGYVDCSVVGLFYFVNGSSYNLSVKRLVLSGTTCNSNPLSIGSQTGLTSTIRGAS